MAEGHGARNRREEFSELGKHADPSHLSRTAVRCLGLGAVLARSGMGGPLIPPAKVNPPPSHCVGDSGRCDAALLPFFFHMSAAMFGMRFRFLRALIINIFFFRGPPNSKNPNPGFACAVP